MYPPITESIAAAINRNEKAEIESSTLFPPSVKVVTPLHGQCSVSNVSR
jgi:hypothetical protein